MTKSMPPLSPMIAGIDQLIETTRERTKIMRTEQLLAGKRRHSPDEPPSSHTLEELELFVGRLRQIKEWLVEDTRLLHIVDAHVGQHVHAMEKRQSLQSIWSSVITTLVGAILGWLTSTLASPITLWHLLFH
jgi:hypothetical protein